MFAACLCCVQNPETFLSAAKFLLMRDVLRASSHMSSRRLYLVKIGVICGLPNDAGLLSLTR